jgi:hypothetical protein
MSKPTKKRSPGPKTPAGAAATPSRASADAAKIKTTKAGPGSKQSRVIAMLQSPAGTTVAAMMKATGWQQHSVRGFLTGVVRKRLNLKLASAKIDQTRVYRISREGAGKAGTRSISRRTR